ncbi:MAG: hypothetical protein KGJ59_00805 [Bacteroidota bacterium]|nr:hypothetical protein [Bacteroidota bacterium]
MKPYRITAMKMGETSVPSAEIFWMTKLVGWEMLTFWSFLIENDERKVLLNTGFPQDYSALHKHWTSWAKSAMGEEGHVPIVTPDHWIVNALGQNNVRSDDVTDVLVTPLTAYATGGLDQFAKASLWFSRRGWLDFHAPDPEIPQLPRRIIFPDHVLQWLVGPAASRIRLLDDEEQEFLPGIRAWFCGGHHRSSMVFAVQTRRGTAALTDAVFKYRNFEERIPLGLSESLEEHYRLFAKLKRSADIIIPLYDPLLMQRHERGVIE